MLPTVTGRNNFCSRADGESVLASWSKIDGSEHAWFEDRGEMCTLLAFGDDGTSRLMQLRFGASESAFDYLRATRPYLEAHGKSVAFYSDKHSIFRVNVKDAVGGIALHSLAVCDRMIAQDAETDHHRIRRPE